MEKSSGRKIKIFRSDNGGEYTSSEFASYLTKEGIKHELTIPHTPQQNGVAERLNRTLIESVRTMLADSKLPHRFWAEALATSVYLRNRSPTKAVEAMTPYEAWSGAKPDVSFLRVFGCSAYAHVPKVERRKLDSKARKCVMLGYGTSQKGYRLYDIEQMKVVHSRDVVFDETSMPGIQKEEGTTVKYVELDIEEESDANEILTSEPTDDVHVPDDTTVQQESSEESVSANRNASESVPRRSTRSKQKPDRYSHNISATVASIDQDPCSVSEARSAPDKDEWERAMKMEMDSRIQTKSGS